MEVIGIITVAAIAGCISAVVTTLFVAKLFVAQLDRLAADEQQKQAEFEAKMQAIRADSERIRAGYEEKMAKWRANL